MSIRKATFKHIESELANYQNLRKELELTRNEIMYTSMEIDENDTSGKNSVRTIARPTERIGLNLASDRRLLELERMVVIITSTYDALDVDKQRLIRLYYWTKPQTRTWEGIAEELQISRVTALRWRNGIILEMAKRLGWK